MKTEKFATMTKYFNGRTKGGNWSTVKQDLTVENIDQKFYSRIVDQPWSGDRMERSYTNKGYLVTRVTSINPSNDLRVVYEFDID